MRNVVVKDAEAAVAGIKDGAIYGTVVQQPYEFGYQAIKMMAQVLAGDRSQIPPGKQKYVETRIIKRDTVEDFTKKINELRGR